MTFRIVKPLELVRRENGCDYYSTSNPGLQGFLLKVYRGNSGRLYRVLNVFVKKRVIGPIVGNEIEEVNQRRILALSEISQDHWSNYLGKVLLVKKLSCIPVNFIIEEEGIAFISKEEAISRDEVLGILSKLSKGRDSLSLLNAIEEKANLINSRAQVYFSARKLFIENLSLNFGIDFNDDNDPVVVWTGEGITSKTAVILNDSRNIVDSEDLAKIILPPDIYKKEIGELD